MLSPAHNSSAAVKLPIHCQYCSRRTVLVIEVLPIYTGHYHTAGQPSRQFCCHVKQVQYQLLTAQSQSYDSNTIHELQHMRTCRKLSYSSFTEVPLPSRVRPPSSCRHIMTQYEANLLSPSSAAEYGLPTSCLPVAQQPRQSTVNCCQ